MRLSYSNLPVETETVLPSQLHNKYFRPIMLRCVIVIFSAIGHYLIWPISLLCLLDGFDWL